MLRQVVRKAAACGQVPHQQVRWHLIADEVQRRMQCLLHSDHWAALESICVSLPSRQAYWCRHILLKV